MRRATLMRSCAWVIVLYAQSSLAQAATEASPAPVGSAAAPTSSATLQEIVVTAQRRSENLQRAAIAVSVVGGDALREAGVSRPTELTALVPSLQVTPNAGPYSMFYLRGVGNFASNTLTDAAVAFNYAGVYIDRTSSTTGYFYDLERIEVVKGPQGTLYGRNATGGAINVIPKTPQLGVVEGELMGEYGNYDSVRLEGHVNLPLSDTVAVRAAGTWVRHDGYMNDGTDDQNDLGGRLSLRWTPADSLNVVVSGDYFQSRGRGPGSTPLSLDHDDRIGLLSPQGRAFYASQPNLILGRTFSPIDVNPFQKNHYAGISSTIEWRTDLGTLTIIPAYRTGDLNYLSYTPGFQIRQREHDAQTSVEMRFATDDAKPLRALVGAFYYHATNDWTFGGFNLQSLLSLQNLFQKTTSKAAFGRVTFAPVPQFRLTAGARYTRDDKDFSGVDANVIRICRNPTTFFPSYVPGCPSAQAIPFTTVALPAPNFDPTADGTITVPTLIDNTGVNAKHLSFDRFTYRLGADWDVTPRNLLYAAYETGFKAGGFFFSADQGTFRPEDIAAYTVGSKNRFLDNRLQLNLEAFYWLYRNQQASHLSADSQGNLIFPTENVGKATFKGVEIETQFLLTPNTLLTGDVQYLDAVYKRFTYVTPNQNGGAGNGTGCPSSSVGTTSYTVNCSGFRPPNAPRWTLNVSAQQTFPMSDGGKFVANLRAHYQSRTLFGLEFTPIEYQNAYWIADASLTYYSTDSRYFVGGFVNNLTNKTVVSASLPTSFALFSVGTLRVPRTFGIRAGTRF